MDQNIDKNTKLMHLIIKSKSMNYFTGDVTGITAYNDVGIFDVLPMHANFISLIKNKVTIHKPDGQKEIDVGEKAVLKAEYQNISIYVGV